MLTIAGGILLAYAFIKLVEADILSELVTTLLKLAWEVIKAPFRLVALLAGLLPKAGFGMYTLAGKLPGRRY
jgi:hypothetical protein